MNSKESMPRIIGYAAVFNSPTTERFAEIYGFTERILPGAFADVINSKQDVRAFFAHDEAKVLGRQSAGTLTMREDARGLYVEITPPNTQAGRDAVESIRRGDITGMSWRAPSKHIKDKFTRENGELVRTISKIGRLVEVSPVSIPAYEAPRIWLRDPSATARSLVHSRDQRVSDSRRYGLDEKRAMRLRLLEATVGLLPPSRLDLARKRLAMVGAL
jgi:HK97 family phage prohead protease